MSWRIIFLKTKVLKTLMAVFDEYYGGGGIWLLIYLLIKLLNSMVIWHKKNIVIRFFSACIPSLLCPWASKKWTRLICFIKNPFLTENRNPYDIPHCDSPYSFWWVSTPMYHNLMQKKPWYIVSFFYHRQSIILEKSTQLISNWLHGVLAVELSTSISLD